MIRSQFATSLIVLGLSISIISCKKKTEDTPTPVTTPTPTAPTSNSTQGFFWSENGNATSQKAATAYFTAQYNTLIATNASGTIVEINLTAGTAGTYTINSSNALTYLPSGNTLVATSGSVIISANTSNKMSGSFSVAFTGGSVSTLKGTFTDIEVK